MASSQESSPQAKKQAIFEGKKKHTPLPTINELQETSQGVNASQQQANIQGGTTFTSAINEEGEWTTVTRRKSRINLSYQGLSSYRRDSRTYAQHPGNLGNRRNPPTGGTVPEEIQKAYHTAFKERRCFRYLSKSHKRAQCREPLRCFKCKQIGHQMSRCSHKFDRQKQPLNRVQRGNAALPKLTTQNRTYA